MAPYAPPRSPRYRANAAAAATESDAPTFPRTLPPPDAAATAATESAKVAVASGALQPRGCTSLRACLLSILALVLPGLSWVLRYSTHHDGRAGHERGSSHTIPIQVSTWEAIDPELATPAASGTIASALEALSASARPLPAATTAATAETIAAAATARQPKWWRRSFASGWKAHERWKARGRERSWARLSEVVPWALAGVQEGEAEFILTAPSRGGGAPLLDGGPPWERLRAVKRNVTVTAILDHGRAHAGTSAVGHGNQATGTGGAAPLYYYHSGTVGEQSTQHWQAQALLDDLAPLAPLEITDVPPLGASEPQPPAHAAAPPVNRTAVRLWLTSSGVLARTHYDKSHNVLSVIVGQKQVLLWPPSELPALHLYPAVHAAHRQSQLSITRLDSVRDVFSDGRRSNAAARPPLERGSATTANEADPAAAAAAAADDAADGDDGDDADDADTGNAATPRARVGAADALASGPTPSLRGVVDRFPLVDVEALLGRRGAVSVRLGTGDVLYIPPYWAHAVFSPTPSVAVAAFSTSWEQARWARSGWLLAPLGRFAAATSSAVAASGGSASGVCTKARGAALLITAFLHACSPVLGGTSPRAFLARLYASRFAPLYGALHDAHTHSDADRAGGSARALAECLSAPPHTLPPGAPELDAGLRQRVRAFAASVAALLTQPDVAASGRVYDPAVAAELAGDYVEESAGWAVGAAGAWRLLRQLSLTAETDELHDFSQG